MALILDNRSCVSGNPKHTDSLVHSYNRKCFSNYEEALHVLTNKVLLPGEVAFGYYYDALTPYGQNAIAAVGPVTLGSGNIIFKNSVLIDTIKDDLLSIIADNVADNEKFKDEVTQKVEDEFNYIKSTFESIYEYVLNASNLYTEQNETLNDFIILNVNTINEKIDASFLLLESLIIDTSNSVNKRISDVSDSLLQKIEKDDASVVKYITDQLYEGFNEDEINKHNYLGLSISEITDLYKDNTNRKLSDLYLTAMGISGQVNSSIVNMYVYIDFLNTSISKRFNSVLDSMNVLQEDNVTIHKNIEDIHESLVGVNASIINTDNILTHYVNDLNNNIESLRKQMLDISAMVSGLIDKQNDLENEHIEWKDDINSMTSNDYNIDSFKLEVMNRLHNQN